MPAMIGVARLLGAVALSGQPGATESRLGPSRVTRKRLSLTRRTLLYFPAATRLPTCEQRAASQYIRAFRDPANDDAYPRTWGLTGLLLKTIKWDKPDNGMEARRARGVAEELGGPRRLFRHAQLVSCLCVVCARRWMKKRQKVPAFAAGGEFPKLNVPHAGRVGNG